MICNWHDRREIEQISKHFLRARSLPQRDFLPHDADYYPLHRGRRPYSNLGDYGGYDQGINTYFGHDPYMER